MATLNYCQFMGRVAQEPKVHTFQDGNKVANLNLAVNEAFKNKEGEKQEETTWLTVVAYGKTADFVQTYIGKGRAIYVAGRLRCRKYEADGGTRDAWEVVADNLQPLEWPKDVTVRGEDIAREMDAQYHRGSGDGWSGRPMRKHGDAAAARERLARKQAESLDPNPLDLPFDRRPQYSR